MIGLSTKVLDLNGFLVIQEGLGTTFPQLSRRVTRTATLDRKSVINDSGYSEGDHEYLIHAHNMSMAEIAILEYMVKTYSIIRISSKLGCFEGVIEYVNTNLSPVVIKLLITKQIS